MNSRERMALAMQLQKPDRVPVMCQLALGHYFLNTGYAPHEIWFDSEAFAEALVMLQRRYRFDGILVSLHGHAPDWERRIAGFYRELDGERIRWKSGDSTFFPGDDLPVFRPAQSAAPPDFSGFDPSFLPPRVGYIPVSQGLRFALDPEHLYDAVVGVVGRAGRDFSVHGEVTSPLDYYLDLFGFEQAMVGLLEDPGRAAAILDRFTDGIVAIAEGLAASGVDAVKISSPFAGAGFLSTAFYRTFVLPNESRIARAAEALGVRAYIHTCGDIHDRLELMAASGASGIECLDPPPLGRVDLEDAKARVGSRIFIKGNVDPVYVLLAGDPVSVRADARRRLAAGKPGGRYILSSACSIAPRTPEENVRVLAEVAAADGVY